MLHLNPAVHFSKLLDGAHSVVLAGGTMQPFADLEQQVVANLPPGRLRTLSLGHIVPPSNLLPLVLPLGPSGTPLQFNFAGRAKPPLMDELGATLLLLCKTVPDGVVVFVPSFGYEEQLVAHWQASGVWNQLARLKKMSSPVGGALDFMIDELKAYLLIGAVGARWFLETSEVEALWVALRPHQ